MKYQLSTRKLTLTATLLIALLLGLGFVAWPQQTQEAGAITLQAPPFLGVAHASTAASAQRLNDLGICGYIESGQTIDLNDVQGTYEVVEDQTADYIIGSVSVPDYEDQQDEIFHVHVYVSTDGWILSCFLDDRPVSMIIDWKAYVNSGGTSITTLFEKVLVKVASDANVPYEPPMYYDFRFPNATHMLLVADYTTGNNDDFFRIELPSDNIYYQTSWGIYRSSGSGAYLAIDGTTVGGSNPPCSGCIGFNEVQLAPNSEHLIQMDHPAGLAIVYKEQ